MAGNILVDAGFVVALLSRRDVHHKWAVAHAERLQPTWTTGRSRPIGGILSSRLPRRAFMAILRRRAVAVNFDLDANLESVLQFMQKYANVPASLADASLVRMTETLRDLSF